MTGSFWDEIVATMILVVGVAGGGAIVGTLFTKNSFLSKGLTKIGENLLRKQVAPVRVELEEQMKIIRQEQDKLGIKIAEVHLNGINNKEHIMRLEEKDKEIYIAIERQYVSIHENIRTVQDSISLLVNALSQKGSGTV